MKLVVGWAIAAAAGLVLLSACGGGDGGEGTSPEGTSPPAQETEAPGVTAEATAATSLPEITSLCDLVTQEDVEEALGDSVTGATEFMDVSCTYSIASGSLNIGRGSQEDFEVGGGVFGTGDLGEPVPGVGDQAAWWFQADVGAGVAGDQGILSVRKGDFYCRVNLFLSGVDEAAQLEIAKDLADKAVQRLP